MATIIEWSNQLVINHQIIDEQHQEMIAMINRLHDCIVDPGHRAKFADQLEQLCNYTMDHFATEEALMQQLSYPHLARHREQHIQLSRQALELNQRFGGGEQPLTTEITQSLREWLLNHNQGEDRELGLFLLQKREELS